MVRLFAALLDHDADGVTRELLNLGVMQFIDIAEFKREWEDRLGDVNPEISLSKVTEIRRRIEGFLSPLEILFEMPDGIDLESRRPIDLESANRDLDGISDELESIRGKQRTNQQEILKLEDISRQVGTYGVELSEMSYGTRYSYITVRTGKVTGDGYERLSGRMRAIPSVMLPARREEDLQYLILVFMKRDTERVEQILSDVGWTEEKIADSASGLEPDVASNLREKISALYRQQEELADKAIAAVKSHIEELRSMWIQLRVNELFYRIQSYFKRSSRTVIFSGWIPASMRNSVTEAIKKETGGNCVLEWHRPEKDNVPAQERVKAPVQLHNPRFMKPFQMLVTNYGVPEYGTIDPTFFTMIAYLAMYGLMFADVGHGAVLCLAGLFGSLFLKPKRKSFRDLFMLVIWCGASSVVTGVLFGSYFGMAWLKPLWFDFHGIISGHPQGSSYITSVYDILRITLYFGIGIIGIGLLFNWVNLSIKRQWTDLILEKRGLLGGWFYFGGIYIARYMVLHDYKAFPPMEVTFLLVGIPALLFYVKAPLHFYSSRKEREAKPFTFTTLMNFGMNWIVEVLDLFSGYLSNTLSFMRVAGLGIAHVTLMMSFFQLAEMANPGSGFSPWSILIILFGNILVIGLEGLTAGIQALRLNYYEFFSKFFHGSGEIYSPLSLKSRA
jgi:V/A-type H+-transporting ATPase subunit I